ncbi:MAG TPA: polysaccharide deacetylase family protein [Candidatus Acidoferrales bacterium]|nr:polysaccharide deacetylase family protein [Candidatus Acidoferrales bacterium]
MTINPAWFAAGGACAAGGLLAWGALAPGSQLFGRTLRRLDDTSSMAITFDDGPNPAVTPRVLEILARQNATATFFLIGQRVRAFPGLAREIAERGHALGNHTETHPSLTFLSAGRIAEELQRCQDAIASATGKIARWMRPPFGYRSPLLDSVVRRRGGAGVAMWNVAAKDWRTHTPESVIQRLRRARGGDIVLLHDGDHRVLEGKRGHVLAALEYWLPRWRDAGIQFVNLDAGPLETQQG